MSISSLLFTSRDALLAHQMAIDITGANIANASTTEYTRQRANLQAVGTVDVGAGVAQSGVNVSRIERTYDRYIESEIVEQQQNSSYSEAMLQGLQSIETILDDTGGNGLSDQLNAFWNAWDSLSGNPASQVERSDLLSTSGYLVDTLNTYSRNLDSINSDMTRNIADAVSQINGKVAEISSLNEKILSTSGGDIGNNNDLLDKRSLALQELAEWVNFTPVENEDGTVNVYLPNGDPLVLGLDYRTLHASPDTSGCYNVYTSRSADEPVNSVLTGGKLGAYLNLQSDVVPRYLSDIDQFTIALANRVNELHASGYDAKNNTGTAFFNIADQDNAAGSITVNSVISADVNRIACSESVSGDGNIAGKIAAVQNELLMNSGTSTLNNYLANMVGQIGNDVSNAGADSDRQTIIMNHLYNQRESVSGVSIDEEMILLIKYQMGYTAAGKLCSTVNDMLDTLMGLVK